MTLAMTGIGPNVGPRRLLNVNFLKIAFLMLVGASLSGCGVNNIPTYEEQAAANWSQVLNQYQRRADLVPNLVQTVRPTPPMSAKS